MPEEPEVTVLMPTHNQARYLSGAIESVLAQTFPEFELLVVDDGSTDESPSILSRYGDPRLKPHRQDRRGLTTALNAGLSLSRGRLIARLDADDEALPTRLEQQVAAFRQDSQLALLGSAAEVIDGEGRLTNYWYVAETAGHIRWGLLFGNQFCHSSVMFRRGAVESAGGFNESFRYAQDYDLWSRVAARFKVANLPQPLVRWRRNPLGVSARFAEGQQEYSVQVALRNLSLFLESAELPERPELLSPVIEMGAGRLARIPHDRAVASYRLFSWLSRVYAAGGVPGYGVDGREAQHILRGVRYKAILMTTWFVRRGRLGTAVRILAEHLRWDPLALLSSELLWGVARSVFPVAAWGRWRASRPARGLRRARR